MEQPDPLTSFFDRAKRHNVPMSAICDRAGVARSTPSRWRNDKNGATLAAVKALEDALTFEIDAREHPANCAGVAVCSTCSIRAEDPAARSCTATMCGLRAREAA